MESQTIQPGVPPAQQVKPFLLVWHSIFLGMLWVCLGSAFWMAGGVGREQMLLAGLVSIQSALYLWAFARPRSRRLLIYFAVAVPIWWVETRLSGLFAWVMIAYLGQVFGAFHARGSVPAGILFLALLVGGIVSGHVRFEEMPPAFGYLGFIVLVLSVITMGFFLRRLIQSNTERAALIGELQEATRRLQAARQKDAELAVLRERERLARDLHDGLGHAFATLSVQLEAAQRLYPGDPERGHATLDTLKQLVRRSLEDLRRALSNLRSSGIENCPLVDALQTLATDFASRTGLRVHQSLSPQMDSLSPGAAEAIWRVAQEALRNVEQHASAETVEFHAVVANGRAVLTIADDGVGWPENAEDQPDRYGLRGIRERVAEWKGMVERRPAQGGGSILRAEIPLPANQKVNGA